MSMGGILFTRDSVRSDTGKKKDSVSVDRALKMVGLVRNSRTTAVTD